MKELGLWGKEKAPGYLDTSEVPNSLDESSLVVHDNQEQMRTDKTILKTK